MPATASNIGEYLNIKIISNQLLYTYLNVPFHTEYVCYDDGCHLRKFARNCSRCDVSAESKILAKQHIVVDKMHMRGHIDQWCKLNCDPANYPFLDDVSTSFYAYLVKYCICIC